MLFVYGNWIIIRQKVAGSVHKLGNKYAELAQTQRGKSNFFIGKMAMAMLDL